MILSKLSPRKAERKIRSDGFVNSVVTAADLFTREWIGRYVFDFFVDRSWIRTLSRKGLKKQAVLLVETQRDRKSGPTPFVAQIEGGYVFTKSGLLMNHGFEIIEESAAPPGHAKQPMMAMLSREFYFGKLPVRSLVFSRPPSNVSVLDTVAPLIPRYPTNYYHWMVETVPKIRCVQEFEKQTDTEITILVPSNAPSFVRQTLDLFNWPKSKTVFANESIYFIQNLMVPSSPELNATDFEWLRSTILDAPTTENEDELSPGSRENKVYVSRANAISRRVVNEDEVMEVLSEYGFERYLLENRSLAENARLFSQADIVVGPHGAGLTDIIFADDCALVELFGSRLNMAYKNLSKTLGIEYESMYCEADSSDIVVDTEQLERRISKLVQDNQ